jgi:cytochrome c556
MRLFCKSGLVKLGVATLCAMAAVSTAHAQEGGSPEENAVALRQSLFKLIGYSFDPVARILRNQQPFDAATVQKSAARLEGLAPMVPEVFTVDTRKASVKTKAREGIWTNNADFKAKNDAFVKAVANLSAVAKSGDKKTVTQAAAAVGKACGACHDSFRDK